MADIRRSNGDYCDYVNTPAQPVSDVAIDDLELEVVTEVSVVAVVAEAVSLAAGNTTTQTELKKSYINPKMLQKNNIQKQVEI